MTDAAIAERKPQQWRISASTQAVDDPLLDCLVLLTEHYGSPCSGDALTAGLPMTDALLTPDLFPQAAARAGLTAKLSRRQLKALPKLLLPCILLLTDKKACILREIRAKEGIALIQTSETGGEEEISLAELESMYAGYAFLVKRQYRGDNSVDLHLHNTKIHWFWQTVRDASPIYRDALIASVLINIFALVSPLFVMNVYDKVVPNLAFESLWVLATGALIAFSFDFLMKKMRSYLIDIAGKKVDIIVSSRLFARLMGIPLEKRAKSVGGMAKQLGEFDGIRDMLTSATLTTLVDLPFAAFFLFVIYIFAGDLAAVPVVAGVLIIGYALLVQPRLKAAIEESNKYASQKHGHLIESLSAMEGIKSNVAEGIVQKSWQQMTAHTANWNLKVKQITNSVSYFASFIVQVTSVAVVVLGVYRVADAQITMGGIIAAVMLSSRAVSPMAQLAGLMSRWNQTQSGMRQLNAMMDQEDEFADKGQLVSRKRLKGDIYADNIGFSYPESEKPTLHPTSFTINAGEKIAILGKNGTGKSTLIRMLSGLYQPTAGSLRFDGIDAKQIHPADLRRNVGYLAQDVTLFHGTIRENIMFGTRQVTEHQLIRATQLSGVGIFTSQDSEGLDKQVGERGETLSRGQRQSVALARALLNDPPLLIMDEPTASLDAHAENQFIHAMKFAAKDRTLVMITHKMALLSLVDRVIVMDKGRVVMDGPKDKVLERLNGSSGSHND
ncbi:type I secretion system permease/ATPase [Enterovibrio sp. ZSDZ35]|uniref:Type I secretion system permease/ATPase n=1 Tax=Enterovibrio qingdaonensis TaxID=2899818 RepID=A0ABT5QTL4_9GAMM|nr:type I secretion system permease/ATPase [Enterovibrio sp. ZSDZ35]MDD1783929.1 type I secretion system permease/ATPase [Enterovibrio sp. ZSDZ35]